MWWRTRPRISFEEYTGRELRYRALADHDPQEARRLHALAQQAVDLRWQTYEELATRPAAHFPEPARRD